MRPFIKQARGLFYQPMGRQMPYHDGFFRGAYLLAYFPYYIEPIYYTLALEKMEFAERPNGIMKAAFLGGGPVPEALGLAAYLRDRAPHITAIHGTVFDREKGWNKVQQELLPIIASHYLQQSGCLNLEHKPCDVVNCMSCNSSCDSLLGGTDFIISQNFLTEIYNDREKAFHNFRNIIAKSKCRAIVFVENAYGDIFRFMDELAGWLHAEGITTKRGTPKMTAIRSQVKIPDTLLENLFTGESGLIPKRSVKFHHMVLRIKR